MHIVFIAILVLIILLAGLSFALSSFSMRIPRLSVEEVRKWLEDRIDISWYDKTNREDYTVKSNDGYDLHAQLIRNSLLTDKYVIISHGYTDNFMGSVKYAKIYLGLGFNVILYDLRGHGLNEPTYCTYSIRESRDLKEMIKDSRARYPECRVLGIHGESLGAATSIAVLKYKPDIDFVVSDCAFGEITPVMKGILGRFHLPGRLVSVASQFTKLRYGYFYRDMRPEDSLADNEIPILFIHGEADDLIAPSHSEKMKEMTKGYSEIFTVPGAGHAESVLTAPAEYEKRVEGFLCGMGIIR